jgi:cell division protein FtsB
MRDEATLTRALTIVLGVMLLALQARLWASDDGFREVARLDRLIGEQRTENERLSQRNLRLEAEVIELRRAGPAVEERARADLGLIGPNETFFLLGAPQPAG